MSSDDEILNELFSLSEEEYGKDYKNKLFEQYRLFLRMLDSLTHRRTIANNFFLSINTGLLAAFGLLTQLGVVSFESNSFWVLGVSIAGILFSYSWFRTVKSYKQLSTVKWRIVLEIERRLPMKLHETEWKLLGEGKNRKKYWQLTDVERIIPFIFIGIYGILILILILIIIL